MEISILKQPEVFKRNLIDVCNTKLGRIIKNHHFCLVSEEIIQNSKYSNLYKNMAESKVIIVNYFEEADRKNEEGFFLITFFQTVLLIKQSSFFFVESILSYNKEAFISFYKNSKDAFNSFYKPKYRELELDRLTLMRFGSLHLIKEINQGYLTILSCITCFQIQQSILKLHDIDRIDHFISKSDENILNQTRINGKEYMTVNYIGNGSSFQCELIYHIEKQELFVIKKQYYKDTNEINKLMEREFKNYSRIKHPLFPIFYGQVEGRNFLVIEYINGVTLANIHKIGMTIGEKLTVIFELMISIEYLHDHHFIYRDLRPSNVMIDYNKNLVLIDFDRMIDADNRFENANLDQSCFLSTYAAPETSSNDFSYECDIYSIGQLIRNIFNKPDSFEKFNEINQIIEKCINNDPTKRPSIKSLIREFYDNFHTYINMVQINKFYDIKASKSGQNQNKNELRSSFTISNKSKNQNQIKFQNFESQPKSNLIIDLDNSILSYDLKLMRDFYCFNHNFNTFIQSYNFIIVSKPIDKYGILFDEIKESNVIIVQYFENEFKQSKEEILVFAFKKTIILVKASQLLFIEQLLIFNEELSFCFLPNTKEVFDSYYMHKYKEIEFDSFFMSEIREFDRNFRLRAKNNNLQKIWHVISSCIYAYLIKQCYIKSSIDRIKSFIDKQEFSNLTYQENINEKNYIRIRPLSHGSLAVVYLCYNIEKEEFFTLKLFFDRTNFLYVRVLDNYMWMNHPLIPRFYGFEMKKKLLAIEYIDGVELFNIKRINPSFKEKLRIIFELMIVIEYIHRNGFIHRHLKPDNIIIDKNKHAIIIDFSVKNNKEFYTYDYNNYVAPEILHGFSNITRKCDIYSLGKLVYFIINERESNENISFEHNNYFDKMCQTCLKEDPNERPSINELIQDFYINFHSQLEVDDLFEYYARCDSNSEIQYKLGKLYYENKYISTDISKSIHYFSLAANQNNSDAQFSLGCIYNENQFVSRDVNKAVHYFSLAANQGNFKAQFNLSIIYSSTNIHIAIHYYYMAACQNYAKAQYNLGLIYYEGKYIQRDINMAIQMYSLAANQNDQFAQFNLALIYYEGKFIIKDIDKAIHYFELSANQNNKYAQYYLGFIYSHIKQDINKAYSYLSLAAQQDLPNAQIELNQIIKRINNNSF